jgi:Uncharacterized conserved protein
MSYGYYYGYSDYVSVGEKRAKAERWIKAQTKKGVKLHPIPADLKLGTSWWGKAWNTNLGSYADFSNRVSRGRSYVKNGFVVDFSIDKGHVSGLVMGTNKNPYAVKIAISPLAESKKKELSALCGRKIDSLEALLNGKFPKEQGALFLKLLFPSPSEMKFYCSCPDGAYMCKHVAAVLYAVSARLDEDPLLFFRLRSLTPELLIKASVKEKTRMLLKNASKTSGRVIGEADMHRLFGL